MPRNFVADLHTHSRASDGDLTPTEIVQEAQRLGLEAIALTDHETCAGLREALAAGQACGVQVICGVEVSLRFTRPNLIGSLHYLLYFADALLDNRAFVEMLNNILAGGRGHQLVMDRTASINAHFGPQGTIEPILKRPLSVTEVEAQAENITRRHFALALSQGHHLNAEQINRLIGNDSPAYIPSGIEMQKLRPLFERFAVVRVLAHAAAGSFPEPSVYNEVLPPVEIVEEILPEFLALGLDGLEVYYPGHAPQHVELLRGWAEKHNLLVTGGSDFHDRIKRPLGVAGVNRAELQVLLECLAG